jgi:hypothetical protein
MEQGDKVKATWKDGLVLTGSYIRTERGYVILKSESGERIVCHPAHVEFKVNND